jgi:hypothetical protein
MVGIVCNVPKRLKRQKKLLRPKSGKARQYNRLAGWWQVIHNLAV